MRKFINYRILIIAILMLSIGFGTGAASVSALSVDGESLLNGIVSAGSSLGIDMGGLVTTTTQLQMNSGNAQADLSAFLQKIKFSFSETEIIELTDYVINRNGTFEKWIYSNYGSDVHVPSSVKNMTPSELVIFLMSNKFQPDYKEETTTKYVFSGDEVPEETTTESLSVDYDSTYIDEIISQSDEYESDIDYSDVCVKGDINIDGKITASDARLALRVSAKLESLTEIKAWAADVNGDGKITASDARSILRYSANLISEF